MPEFEPGSCWLSPVLRREGGYRSAIGVVMLMSVGLEEVEDMLVLLWLACGAAKARALVLCSVSIAVVLATVLKGSSAAPELELGAASAVKLPGVSVVLGLVAASVAAV